MTDCIFCKIIAGEIPSATVYEDDKYKVMLDINPANYGHLLVIPKKHSGSIFEIDENTLCGLYALTKKISDRINSILSPDGINIVQNNGAAAGQTVNHFHVHIIPRYENDGITMGWKGKSPSSEEINAMCEKIKSQL